MDTTKKIIRGVVNGRGFTITSAITQWDYGWQFIPEIEDLPPTYRLDFSNDEHHGTALPVYCSTEGAEVPTELIDTGKDVWVWFVAIGDGYGITEYKWRIPNKCKPKTEQDEPTPTQQSSIDQLIVRSNEAVETAEEKAEEADTSARSAREDADRAERAKTSAETAQGKAEDAQESAERAKDDAETSERNASESERKAKGYAETASTKADAIIGLTATATTLPDGSSATASYDAETGVMTFGIPKGKDGRDGTDGDDGYSPTASVTKSGKVATITITDKNGTTSAQVSDGEDGVTGATPNLTIGTVETLEPTESATASITGTPENPVLNLGIPQGDTGEVTTEEFLKAFVTDTASGAIASFTDGADDLPLKSLVVNIDPVQDLHGYDSPWVAGGGKNLFDQENVTVTGSGVVVLAKAIPAGTYTISALITSTDTDVTYNRINLWDENNAQLAAVSLTRDTRASASFMIASACAKVVFYAASTAANSSGDTATFTKVQIEEGTTATDWTPYENICPISGWTGMEIQHDGKNLFDKDATSTGNGYRTNQYVSADGAIAGGSNFNVSEYISVKPNMTYIISPLAGSNPSVAFYDSTKAFISGIKYNSQSSLSFTTPQRTMYIRLSIPKANADIFQLELGSIATAYEPYNGTTLPVSWETEAGTVYGGRLDAIRGVMTITNYFCTPDNAAKIVYGIDSQSNLPYAFFTFARRAISTSLMARTLCSMYKAVATQRVDKSLRMWTSEADIWDSDLDVTSLDTVKAYFADLVIVYPLETPIEIQLDSHTLNSLYGQNNIFADTGDCAVEYRADTKLYIEKLTQPEENDMIADSAITEGQFFMIGNSLYRALANIASGATITIGTNAQRVSLSDALNLVNA